MSSHRAEEEPSPRAVALRLQPPSERIHTSKRHVAHHLVDAATGRAIPASI